MSVFLHAIETAVPPHVYPQSVIRDVLKAQPELDRLGQRIIGTIFNASGIDQRHSAIGEFKRSADEPAGVFYDPATHRMLKPSTGTRNAFYIVEASKLFVQAARQVMAASPSILPADITHVVTVSCTGFFAPGPDYAVVRALGLRPDVQRFHVGFMGCYAAFPALKMAKAFCEADKDAVVLVVSAELCTLHMHASNDPDTLIASSVFADGAAAALVSARRPSPGTPVLRMDHFETTLTPAGVGEADMAWTIGDLGYDMVLSTYVPSIIETHISGALVPLLAREAGLADAAHRDIEHWAIHPGGRSILDKVETALSLTPEQLQPSRDVLREYGNMSSATVLFILRSLLHSAHDDERVCAMAFGPGLTVESGLLTKLSGLD
ncbi:type III polyketide synthase [Deinococcus sp. Arct2-2]|uniref:type III polyketide synthase n=1 Tax=Deinococcus sp. Arct2-2 TaxID=2568653 RepID=UPI0010A55636|nr:3-oxoacyl-[acyl-carrier-protein] synthase III C-terminal domain-containing protein [Deinococcus sp. Arct2-2]THF68728.1 type III polyketide synthase [Deinococcus sp. Arct2-2]